MTEHPEGVPAATAVSFGTETAGSMAVSPVNAPGDHAACDAAIARLKAQMYAIASRVARVPPKGAYLTPEQELAEDLLDIITGKEAPS